MNRTINLLLIAAAILAAIVASYSNHFHNDFHFDDSHTITDNGYIRELSNIPLFFKDCTTSSAMPSHQGYRPLVTTTLAIDYALSLKKTKGENGYDTTWYHISNFTWFLFIVILIYFIQLRLYNFAFDQPYNQYFALLGCAWYGLHTANAETVNYIISRSDILSTLGIVGSFAMYVAFPKLRRYYLYLIPAAIGMFAKETTIMFAPALIAYDYLIEQQKSLKEFFSLSGIKNFGKSILLGLPALVLCLFLGILSVEMTKHHEPGGTSTLLYAISQPYIILHYIIQFFFPFGLTADTDIGMIDSLKDDRLYIGFAFLAGLLFIAFKTSEKKEWRPVAFGIVWFLLMLLPTSSFIALAEVTNDHRAFLPYIGLIFAMVCLVANLFYYVLNNNKEVRAGMIAFLCIMLCGYAYGVHTRNAIWKTDEGLWKDVTEKSPNNGRGWMNYGLTLMGKGDYKGAESAYNEAMPKTPRYYILHINMAILKNSLGKKDEAEQYYKNALQYGPNYVEPYYYYSMFLFKSGRTQEAEIYCNKGLEIFPGHLYSRYLQMEIYNFNKDWAKLLASTQATLATYPNDEKAKLYLDIAKNPSSVINVQGAAKEMTAAELLNQSLAFYYAGKYRECIDACNKAIAIQPNYPEAYNNLGSAYNQLQKFDSAVWACTKAVELKPDFQLAKNNLAWAKSQLKK